MNEIEELLRERLHEMGDAYEPAPAVPQRISQLIERGGTEDHPHPWSFRHGSRRSWATGFVIVGVVVGAILVAVVYGPRSAVPGGGSHPTPGKQPNTQSTEQLRRALRAWSGFPVNASRRPLILLEGQVGNPSSGGFPDDASKIAFGDGAINVPAEFPPGPAASGGFALLSARQAFGLFKSTAGQGPPATVDLTVTSVRLGTAFFQTDRGPRPLPAWLFAFQGVQGPAPVLAVAPTDIYTAPRIATGRIASLGARLGADGRTLTVTFSGAPPGPGPCSANYSLYTAVSKTGVALAVRAYQRIHDRNAVCALQASVRHVVTVLSAPLGNRVVIDAGSDAAVAVMGASFGSSTSSPTNAANRLIVQIELSTTRAVAGHSINGTLVIHNPNAAVNLTKANNCRPFPTVILTRGSFRNSAPITEKCTTADFDVPHGTARISVTVQTQYAQCTTQGFSPSRQRPQCLSSGRQPPLPAGSYSAVVEWYPPVSLPKPSPVAVVLMTG
jgi:hypothetical protein